MISLTVEMPAYYHVCSYRLSDSEKWEGSQNHYVYNLILHHMHKMICNSDHKEIEDMEVFVIDFIYKNANTRRVETLMRTIEFNWYRGCKPKHLMG